MMKKRLLIDSLFSLFIIFYFGIGTYPQLKVGDFKPHLMWARQLAENGTISIPHILFQQLVVIVRAIIPFNFLEKALPSLEAALSVKTYDIAGLVIAISCYLATAWILVSRFSKKLNDGQVEKSNMVGWIAAFVSLVVCPIFIFTLGDRLILGYIPGNILHNPTYILMRPFAILLFFLTIEQFDKVSTRWDLLLAALLIIFATLAKPNFALSFLPALVILLLFHYSDRKKWNWRFVFTLMIPAGVLLLVQYFLTYSSAGDNKVIFAPFTAALVYTHSFPNILFFFLLSLAFPISILAAYWKNATSNIAIQLSWINFLVGLITFLLFTEVASISSLNFLWGPMLGVFILFVESIGLLIGELSASRANGSKMGLREIIPTSILALHVVSGFVYYFATTLYPGPVI